MSKIFVVVRNFVFVWVWWFLWHHKISVKGVCFFGSACAAYVDEVWQRRFLAHAT